MSTTTTTSLATVMAPNNDGDDKNMSSPPLPNVPVVDFGPFMEDQGFVVGESPTQGQLQVAQAMDEACRCHGFLYLTNFGLDQDVQDQVFDACRELFAVDNATKLHTWRRLGVTDNRGYAPYASESHHPARPPELSEKFNIRFPPAHENHLQGCPTPFCNWCPVLLEKLKFVAQRYAMACALALQLPRDFFASTLQTMDQCTIRFLHAPPCDTTNVGNHENWSKAVRVAEHTDFGAFTFLFLANHGAQGFQFKPVEGAEVSANTVAAANTGWQDLVVPSFGPKGAIVNTGALMARWTNDEWKATAHRVIVGSAEMAQLDRYSFAFFADPDVNSMIDVPEQLLSLQNGNKKIRKYPPITSDAYLLEKLSGMGRGEHSDPVVSSNESPHV